MRILHSSDWHLGSRLLENNRLAEYDAFLEWMLATLKEKQVDVLLISGDVFDSTVPSASAKEQYCQFLSRVSESGCKEIIITAGNHDSVAQLNIEAPLLRRLRCRVVTRVQRGRAKEDCLMELDVRGEKALIAAVPFLRVPDVARTVSSEDEVARRHAYTDGVADVYAELGEAAAAWKAEHRGPAIAMGHLSVRGAEGIPTINPIIGTLDVVSPEIFPSVFDYVALGHIHKPGDVGSPKLCYSGSPLPVSLDQCGLQQRLVLLETQEDGSLRRESLPVPAFCAVLNVCCHKAEELQALPARIRSVSDEKGGIPVWLHLQYGGAEPSIGTIHEMLEIWKESTPLQQYLARRLPMQQNAARQQNGEQAPLLSLKDYGPERVFEKLLGESVKAQDLAEERRQELRYYFRKLLREAEEEEQQKEESITGHEN